MLCTRCKPARGARPAWARFRVHPVRPLPSHPLRHCRHHPHPRRGCIKILISLSMQPWQRKLRGSLIAEVYLPPALSVSGALSNDCFAMRRCRQRPTESSWAVTWSGRVATNFEPGMRRHDGPKRFPGPPCHSRMSADANRPAPIAAVRAC